MEKDKYGLFPYGDNPNPKYPGKGTWGGHKRHYQKEQTELRERLADYEHYRLGDVNDRNGDQRFPINSDADRMAKQLPPSRPSPTRPPQSGQPFNPGRVTIMPMPSPIPVLTPIPVPIPTPVVPVAPPIPIGPEFIPVFP